MMKFLSIAIKDLKELIRDRRGFFFILVFPIFFMLVFGFAFGGMGQTNTPYLLGVVNNDQPTVLPMGNESVNFGDNLTTILKEVKYNDSDVHMFNVTVLSESEAEGLLKNRTIDAVLIIPPNFSESEAALINSTIQNTISPGATVNSSDTNATSTMVIRGDTGFINFGVTQGMLTGVLAGYENNLVTETENAVRGTLGHRLRHS